MQPTINCAPHLHRVFTPAVLRNTIRECAAMVLEWEKSAGFASHPIDAFAVCGVSGMTFGSVLAYHLNRHLVVVRKRGERDCTSSHDVEGGLVDGTKPFTYLFVDDLVASGNTLKWVVEQMNKERPHSRLTGVLTYAGEDAYYNAADKAAKYGVPWVNKPDWKPAPYGCVPAPKVQLNMAVTYANLPTTTGSVYESLAGQSI